MNTASRISRNFFWLFLGDISAKLLLFVTTIWIARKVTDEGFGKIAFAQAILSYFIIATDLGLPIYGNREIAREPARAPHFVANIIGIRLTVAFSLIVASFTALFFFNIETELKYLLLITFLWLIPWSLNIEFAFNGLEKMKFTSLGQSLFQFIVLISALIVVHQRSHILRVPAIRASGELIVCLLLIFIFLRIIKKNPIELIKEINFQSWIPKVRESLVLVASIIIIKIYYSFDTVVLGFYGQMAEVGWYNAAYKIIMMFVTFAGLLQNAFAPFFVREHQNPEKFFRGIRMFALILMLSSTAIAVFLFTFSNTIIPLIFGHDYLNSIWILRYLSLSLIFIFADTIYLAPLLFTTGQKYYLYSVLAGAIVNVILNLILIPHYSYYGAVFATIISNALVFIFGAIYFTRIFKFDWPTLKIIIIAILGFGLMNIILYHLTRVSITASLASFLVFSAVAGLHWRKSILEIIRKIR